MIDIHCHILPATDDGAECLDESVRMLLMASQSGTSAIIATPHCNLPGLYQNYWSSELKAKLASLRAVVQQKGIHLKLYPGQEVFYTPQVIGLIHEEKVITLNHSRYLLVEFDFEEKTNRVLSAARNISAYGYVPVIAHPERYRCAMDFSFLKTLRSEGVLLQVNKDSLIGTFGRGPQSVGIAMLEHRLADFVASDGHSPYVRCPDLEDVHEYICEEFSFDYADYLLNNNPKCVVEDREITYF